MDIDDLINDLLLRGNDDWIDATEVAWVAKSAGRAKGAEEIRVLSLTLIRSAILAGLMEAGNVSNSGFSAWMILPEESIVRIERAWDALDRLPDLGEVCWLRNTAAGDLRVSVIKGELGNL